MELDRVEFKISLVITPSFPKSFPCPTESHLNFWVIIYMQEVQHFYNFFGNKFIIVPQIFYFVFYHNF